VSDGSPGSREAEGEGGEGFYIAQSGRSPDLLVIGGEGKKFLMDGICLLFVGHDKGLRLHLHHIWPRGKPRKLIEQASGSRLANEDH
jgi:hypothetical protein